MFFKYLYWLPNFTKVFTSKTHCIVEEASINVILQLSNKNKITFLKQLIILPARSSYTSFKSSNFHLFKNNLIYLIIFTFFIIIKCNLFIWIFIQLKIFLYFYFFVFLYLLPLQQQQQQLFIILYRFRVSRSEPFVKVKSKKLTCKILLKFMK